MPVYHIMLEHTYQNHYSEEIFGIHFIRASSMLYQFTLIYTYIPDKRKHMVTLTAEMLQLLFHVYLPSLIGKPKKIDPLL